ncbi:hypothetical protein K469DRAFT_789149 [Zopfia rhizophila CBS 207.26]|uniref:AAA+ ATPase domain-containing protein n=1 Tax=Zopfia rhizophila CBS 207.26 TaxID=1314779 RepID=A0A6A6ER14_9PEZI|nr:hypothetical protein K469DRAFT_789149 [Zopfia rhizophila CBS 207.26]
MPPAAISPVLQTDGFPQPSGLTIADGSPMSPSLESMDGLNMPKLSVLRESRTKSSSIVRSRFGRSTSVAFEGHGSVHDFLKLLKNERFRYMPHDGSNWDKVLKWAENIGGVVLLSQGVLSDFMLNSEDATRLICDSCISLIRLGSDHVKVLLKVFSIFHKMSFALAVFLKQNHLIKSAPDVRRELSHAYQEFAHLTFDVKEYCAIRADYGIGSFGLDVDDLDAYIGAGTSSFYSRLESVSTSMWTSERHCSHFDIHAIRDFLSPQDSVVRTIMSNLLYSEFKRAEFTCEWFAPHLRKFLTGRSGAHKVFLITGAACTGKSVLSRWIYEKLQDSIDDDPYDVLSYSVDTNVKYTTSPLTLIKSLLLQVLDRKIGNEALLSRVTKAMQMSEKGSSATEVEATLWSALEASLDEKKLLILIDGLDQLSGVRIGNPPALQTLYEITKTKPNVKAIVLSRPVSDAALKHCQEYLALENQQETSADMQHYVEDFIHSRSELRKLKDAEKHEIIHKYKEAANGSFLWTELQLQTIKHEDSASAVLKLCQKAPKTVDESVDRLIAGLDVKRAETKHILSWVLAAERPLTLKEIKALLEVELDGCAYRPFSGNVEATVRQTCGSLVVIRDGLVYLRHPSIRERLLFTTSAGNKNTKLVIDLKDAHRELTSRSLAYVKIHLRDDVDPQSDLCDAQTMVTAFMNYDLFEYAARYWVIHFRSSSLYDRSGNFNLPAQFKFCFSNATLLALFEGTCLARQYIACEAEKLQNLACTIRKTLFGEHSAAVLQSLILELRIGRNFKSSHLLAEYAYEAWKISHHVCSAIVIQALAEAFIEYSINVEISENAEFFSRKEEILEYLIRAVKHGQNEAKEIQYMKMLAELYIAVNQVEKAVVIYRELYRLRLKVCGHLHHETQELFELLIVHLRTLSLYEEILEITLEHHEYLEQTLAITDERRIQSTLTIIQLYEERKEIFKAEEILVRFWKSVSVEESTTRITELKIDFGLKYSEFLTRYSRQEECEVMLRGLWSEIQSYHYEARFESTMIKRIQKIAKYFSQLEIFTMSRSIYQSLYEHYQKTEQRTSTECITIVTSLAETITKSISYSKTTSASTTTSSTTTSSTTTVISQEERSTLLEVFESSMTSTEISSTTISICQALCSSYMHEERYMEACEIYSRVISKVWTSIESTSVSVEVSTHHLSVEIFELALSLAVCHFRMLHIEIAETIYMNIFHALICSRHLNHHFLLTKIKLIIDFFKETYEYDRVIEIYRELFVWMPICFGKSHIETIKILMEFAQVCFRMRLYKEAATACFYVYSSFHIAHGCLHFDGIAAALLLCEIYETECKWEEAYEVYGYLWRTFVRFGDSYELDVKIVEKIVSGYLFILEQKQVVEYNILFQVAKEYRESCIKFYKHHHEITIKATLAFAEVCERREEHHETSISLYKEVIKYCKETKSEFSKTTLHTCNTRIAGLYASSTQEVSKAVEIYREQFEMCKKTELTSTETITALRSLVTSYKKQSTTESTTIATQTLKTSVLEIFQQESRSEKLIESAQSIAKIYKECNYFEQASSLIQEMRTKIVEEVKKSITSSTKVEQKSYVFLASFQEAISESYSFSSVMAELRSEILMYESYFKATKTQTDYRSIIKSGCGIYFHLKGKSERRSEFVSIEKELISYFEKYLSTSRKVQESVMHYFFSLYIEEIAKAHYEHVLVERATKTVFHFTKTAKFHEAYDLTLLIDRFIHIHGGFRSEFYIRIGFDLAKYLVGVGSNRCGEEKFYGTMLDLSRAILLEALEGIDKIDMEISELEQLLADLVRVLSEQKKYADLERILQILWHTRTVRNTFSSSPLVLWLGRCLIQTLACLNKFSAAIHLCYDIRYNLTHIRGSLDKSTLEFTVLLSELYTEQKRYRDAMELHEDVLARLGEGQSASGLDTATRLRIAHTHTELLKHAYQRQGKFDKPNQHYYDIFNSLDSRFGQEKGWKDQRPALEKWTPGVKEGDTFGCWKAPGRFEYAFEGEETMSESKWREELVRRRSGNWAKKYANGTNGYTNGYVANGNASKNGLI